MASVDAADIGYLYDFAAYIFPGDIVRLRGVEGAPQVEVLDVVDDREVLIRDGAGGKKVARSRLTLQ